MCTSSSSLIEIVSTLFLARSVRSSQQISVSPLGSFSDTLRDHLVRRMCALNEQIEKDSQLGPAFQVGHSFFCPPHDDASQLKQDWYEAIVKTEIVPLLEEYWYDNREKVARARDELLAP